MRSHLGLALFVTTFALGACGGDPPPASTTMTTGPAPIIVETPPFELAAGDEQTKCYYTTLPSDEVVHAVRFTSHMTPGSHHMIMFSTNKAQAPDGTIDDCNLLGAGVDNLDYPIPVYLTQEVDQTLPMPPKVMMSLKARQPVIFQMHYLNATTKPLSPSVKLQIDRTDDASFVQAAPFASYNTKIAVPPGGEQTVSGHCEVPDGVSFFVMTTHSHLHTTDAMAARYNDGMVGATLVDTADWSHPPVSEWQAPYLQLDPGEEIYYQCHYKNDGSTVVRDGESAKTNEMCMAVGYYFPGNKVTVCVDSMSYTL